ncbi:MAG: thrombospondin type 3 repeat-containing protein [Gammaproteobacteria bacterium]|nr:thrombospondin type 3 repeat-containing protein [Gammaproteobacteria bacterium]
MRATYQFLITISFVFMLSACGGSGGGSTNAASDTTSDILTGVFLDSAVEGVRYVSPSNSGVTNSAGEFQYVAGEVIEIYVGNIYLGQVLSASVITPMDLFPTAASINDNRVTNVLRLLQSIDVDGNTNNGIELPANIQNPSTSTIQYLDFSLPPVEFEQQIIVQQVLQDSNVTSLVSATTAQDHFSNNMAEIFGVENAVVIDANQNCEGSNYPCIPGTTSKIEPELITAVGFPMERGVETAAPSYDYIIHSGATHTTLNPLSRNLHILAAAYPDTYNIKNFASELGVGVVSFYTDDVEGGDGSYLYVDGQLVGDLPENSPYISGPNLSDCGYMHDSQIRTIVLPPGIYSYVADAYTSKECVGVTTADPFLCPNGGVSPVKVWNGTFEVSVGSCQIINAQGITPTPGNTDGDGDGVPDTSDAFPLDPTETVDTDLDGIGNNADTDDDNDGTPDITDAFPLDPTETVDTDLDGIGNNADTDDDNDGTPDITDAFPLDPTETVDTDLDGIGNNADTDDDNDGVLDANDAFPLDPDLGAENSLCRIEGGNESYACYKDDGSIDYFLHYAQGYILYRNTCLSNCPVAATVAELDLTQGIWLNEIWERFPSGGFELSYYSEERSGNQIGLYRRVRISDDGQGVWDVVRTDHSEADPENGIYAPYSECKRAAVYDENWNSFFMDTYLVETSEPSLYPNGLPYNGGYLMYPPCSLDLTVAEEPRVPLELGWATITTADDLADADNDGINNYTDPDDDNDGVPDTLDAFPLDASESVDTDGDGIGNNADADDDGDGISDTSDAFPLDSAESIDTDGDGIGNNADTDDDGDGVPDTIDALPLNPSESIDTDGDGVGNNTDSDDDGDGVPDTTDEYPLDSTESVDSDGDGIGDNADTDDDGDGTPDTYDDYPLDPTRQKFQFTVGGIVNSLQTGGVITLQNNGGDTLTITANGTFTFSSSINNGNAYLVSVLSQSAGQVCSLMNNSGTIDSADVTNVTVTCIDFYTVSGTVSGLTGSLVLQNNASDDLTITTNGAFSFNTSIVPGGSYNVTILNQPSEQLCSLGNATGTSSVDVSNVTVTCVDYYTVGGTVTGLTGTLVLQNNAGDDLTITSDGSYTFNTTFIPSGSFSYNVTALSQPVEQLCTIINGSGTASADVSNVTVTCVDYYTVGGTVINVSGNGLVLQNNGGDDLAVSSSGLFVFDTPVIPGGDYNVTIKTQPVEQQCSLANASGVVSSDVSSITVTCVDYYTLGGTVSGLVGSGMFLQNNSGDDLSITNNGSFTFSTSILSGGTYSVTVKTQPFAQNCTVTNAIGTTNGDISNISVSCTEAIGLNLGYGIKQIQLSWSSIAGATHYQVLENPDGISGYTQMGADVVTTSAVVDIAVHRLDWVNAKYMVSACNVTECVDSGEVVVINQSINTIGYFKASNTGGTDSFGLNVSLSADGQTMVVGAYGEDSNATGINGVQTNDSAGGSGAVYVFIRSGGGWDQQAYIKASNTAASDYFGWSVTLSADGNTLAVGAPGEDSNATGINGVQTNDSAGASGAVYVFTRSGTSWSQQAYIKASNTDVGDNFGSAVALSHDGNTLSVGAKDEDSNATGINGDQTNDSILSSGAVYVLSRSGSSWSQQAYIKATTNYAGGFYGASVTLSDNGNTMAVGAITEASVYIYTRSGNGWVQQAFLRASNWAFSDWFGRRVSLSADGNTLAVSALDEASSATGVNGDESDNSAGGSGAVYVFSRNGSDWARQAYIKASNTDAGDWFGWSVTLSADGDSLAVGAYLEGSGSIGVNGDESDDSVKNAGAVYVFARSGSSWLQQAYVKASNTSTMRVATPNDQFGYSVALSADGSTLAVGANHEDSNAIGVDGDQTNSSAYISGAVYLY